MQLIRRQIVYACAGTGKIKDGDGSDTQETPRLEKFDRHCPRRRIFATRINQCSPWSPDYGNRNIWWSTWHVTQVRSVRMQKYQKPNTRGTCHNISWKAIGSFCVPCVLYSFIHVWDVNFFGALDGAIRLIKKNYRMSPWSMSMSTHPLWIFSSRFTAYDMQQTCSKYDIRMDDMWAAFSYMVKSCNLWLVKTCGGFGQTNLISEHIKVGRSSTITIFHYIAWLPS